MKINCISCALVFALSLLPVSANFFVQMKKPYTIEDLFQDDTINAAKSMIERTVSFGNFSGFSARLTKESADRVRNSKMVLNIVRDMPIKVFDYEVHQDTPQSYEDQDESTEVDQGRDSMLGYETQFMAPRHLSRLSRRGPLPYTEPANYYYDPHALGNDVMVYVIDTGVFGRHQEFEGRVVLSRDFTLRPGRGDESGHGTHVAGIVGSATFGVAKKVQIADLKALGRHGEGTLSTVLSALQYAAKHRQAGNLKGIVNLSLGAMKNEVLNDAIEAAIESGLVVVVAAGNFGSDSCKSSPASAPNVISVGAIDDRDDRIAHFSNHGDCVHVFGSGFLVNSVSHLYEDRPTELSGTSMSSPIVAGLAAVLLSQGVDLKNIKNTIMEMGTADVMSGSLPRNTRNLVAFNGVPKEDDTFPPESMYSEANHGPIANPANTAVILPTMHALEYIQGDIDKWASYLASIEPSSFEDLYDVDYVDDEDFDPEDWVLEESNPEDELRPSESTIDTPVVSYNVEFMEDLVSVYDDSYESDESGPLEETKSTDEEREFEKTE